MRFCDLNGGHCLFKPVVYSDKTCSNNVYIYIYIWTHWGFLTQQTDIPSLSCTPPLAIHQKEISATVINQSNKVHGGHVASVPSWYNTWDIITPPPSVLCEWALRPRQLMKRWGVPGQGDGGGRGRGLTLMRRQGDFRTTCAGRGSEHSWFSTPAITRASVILSCSLDLARLDRRGREGGRERERESV